MRKILLIIATIALLAGCSPYREMPPEVVEAVVLESARASAAAGVIPNLKRSGEELDYFRPILEKYGYTYGDFEYTISRLAARKSEMLNAIVTNAYNKAVADKDRQSYLSGIFSLWESMIMEHIADTILPRKDSDRNYQRYDTLVLKTPIDGAGNYVFQALASISNRYPDKKIFVVGAVSDSLLESVSRTVFEDSIYTKTLVSLESRFTIRPSDPFNTFSLKLVARTSGKGKTEKVVTNLRNPQLIKTYLRRDADLKMYQYYCKFIFPTDIEQSLERKSSVVPYSYQTK